MATNKISVDFTQGGTTFRIQGAKYFYNDDDIRGKIGADATDNNDLGDNYVIDKKVMYQRALVRLVAVLGADSVANANGAIESQKKRYFRFWCSPAKVGSALTSLSGQSIDENLLPGSWKIVKVMVPVDSNLA